MKKILLSGALALMSWVATADEGMWLPSLISQRIGDMQEKGFELTAEDIYSINQASLKDAVVLFGRGCTGELISAEGLLLTNHHCGYGQIQKHSSVEHDYLRDGFWAMTRAEELPNPGLTVSFLEYMEDVTGKVLEGYQVSMTEEEREELVKSNSEKIIAEATAEGKGLRATVESLYYGNTYYIFVYREYSDVRLVGAPPSSIGKFGGDTDNWMWPRHTGDFSIFRIYADKDNNPAEYSEDNVPYTPKRFFRISTGGVEEGDFTFVYGFPGSTREYIHSAGVDYIANLSNPHKFDLRSMRLDVQKKYMDQSQAVRIQYSAKNAGVANAWKKWLGEMKGIRRLGTVENKQAYEARFDEWAAGREYEGVTAELDSLYGVLNPYMFAYEMFTETAYQVELSRFGMRIMDMVRDSASIEAIRSYMFSFYKDYYEPIDRESVIDIMEEYDRCLADEFKPSFFNAAIDSLGSVAAYADAIFDGSILADRALVESMSAEALSGLADDPAIAFGVEFLQWEKENILPTVGRVNSEITLKYRDYMRGQMEFEPSKVFYPDANLTLRVAYGAIKGYSPADGVYFFPSSTIEGIMEKDNPNIFDYNIPQELRDVFAEKDYGQWGEGGSVPVCFIATNHTSGGNSGSPVINENGDLIGLNFDRVWEGTMSDIVFDPDFCRNISLDIRYVLFVIDKIGGASHLIEEMVLVE